MKLTLEEIEKNVDREKHTLHLSGDYFASPNLTRINIQLMCHYLKENKDITTFIAGIGDIGVEGARVLSINTTLTTLNVGFNIIGEEGAKALANNTTLTTLNIAHNDIGTEGAIALASNSIITSLDLWNNNVGTDGIKALAENSTLTTLNVGHNDIDAEGAKALASSTTLRSLNISNNYIGVEGAIALVANTTLQSLDIQHIVLNNKGIRIFVNALKNNTTLLNLSYNFTEKRRIKSTIKQILMRNKVKPWLTTVRHARLMAQAQRTDDCPFGRLPMEVLGMINDYAVGANHFSFFVSHFDKRPTSQDLMDVKSRWSYS